MVRVRIPASSSSQHMLYPLGVEEEESRGVEEDFKEEGTSVWVIKHKWESGG